MSQRLWYVLVASSSSLLQIAAGQSSANVPAGTKVEMAVVRPVWAQPAQPGDPVYLQTIFPVTSQGSITIPAGTFVRATIGDVAKPTRRKAEAKVRLKFETLILADSYTVLLGGEGAVPVSDVNIRTSAANDLLLDNGAQVEMTLPVKLTLDGRKVATALALSKPPDPRSFRSATACRPIAGSLGSPDTTIPGTPGTPPTVIAGAPGVPPTVIPGTPATPGTVLPGSPGSAGSSCPAAPLVVSSVAVP